MKKNVLLNSSILIIGLLCCLSFNNSSTLGSFFFDGLWHNCIGSATTNTNTSGTDPVLEVSNIGDTGNDGLDMWINFTRGFGYRADLPDPNTLPHGAYVEWKYRQESSGIFTDFLIEKQEVLNNSGTPRVEITYDASGIGASEIKVEVYDNTNELVYDYTVANNTPAFSISPPNLGDIIGFDAFSTVKTYNSSRSDKREITFIPPGESGMDLEGGWVIFVRPLDIIPNDDPVTKIEMRTAQTNNYKVSVERIAMFEDAIFFHALGSTRPVGEQDGYLLKLQDMDGGGDDGIRADLEETILGIDEKEYDFDWIGIVNINTLPGDDPLIKLHTQGKLSLGGQEQDIGYVQINCNIFSGEKEISADFTPVGDNNPLYQIFNDGNLVMESSSVTSLTVEDWHSSSAHKTKQPGLTKYTNILIFPDDQNMSMNGTSYVGDEVRISAEVGENIWLTKLDMLTDGIASMDITNATFYIEEECDDLADNTFSTTMQPGDIAHIDFATEGLMNQNGEYVLLGFKEKGTPNTSLSNLVFAKLDDQGHHILPPKELSFDFSTQINFFTNTSLHGLNMVEVLTATGMPDGYVAVATYTEAGPQKKVLIFKLNEVGEVIWSQELDNINAPERFARGIHHDPATGKITVVVQNGDPGTAIELFSLSDFECIESKVITLGNNPVTVSAMTPITNMTSSFAAAFAITGRTGPSGNNPYYLILDNNLDPITDFMTYDLDANIQTREEPMDIKQKGNFLFITGSKENTSDTEVFLMSILPFNPSGFSVGFIGFVKSYDLQDKFDLGNEKDIPRSLAIMDNSDMVIAGYSDHNNGRVNSFLIKTTDVGDLLWTKRYTDPTFDFSFCFNMVRTPDNGCYMVGEQYLENGVPSGQGVRLWAAKTDVDGQLNNCNCVQEEMTDTALILVDQVTPQAGTVNSWDCTPVGASASVSDLGLDQNFCDPAQTCTITCAPDITVNVDPGQCIATGVTYGQPTLSGNCTEWNLISAPNQTTFQVGCTSLIWTYESSISGLQQQCATQVCVEDVEAPLISCNNFTVDVGSGSVTFSASDIGNANDNCSIFSETINVNTFDCSMVNTTVQVTYTATDDSGNSAQCMANIFVKDFQSPSIICPIEVNVDCSVDINDPNNTGGFPAVNDLCDPNPTVTFTDNLISGDLCNGVVERVWVVTDFCGNSDQCVQIIIIMEDIPPCCQDEMDFVAAVEAAVTVDVDHDLCKATVNIGDLPACDEILGISWGDGSITNGSFASGSMPMHTYGGTGVYTINITAVEISADGDTCFTHIIQRVVDMDCPLGCGCDGWQWLSFGFLGQLPYEVPIDCGNVDPVVFECPNKRDDFYFHGNFNCTDTCGGVVTWEIVEDGSTAAYADGFVIGWNGGSGNSYHFDINNIPYPPSGNYKLKLKAKCGNSYCTCQLAFTMPSCSPDCVCENPILPPSPASVFDVYQLSGCSNTLVPSFFLDDECDVVTWKYRVPGSIGFTTMGSTLGNDPIVYDFSLEGPGSYTVCMTVQRTLDNGIQCEEEERCQRVRIRCGPPTYSCDNPLIDNPGFTQSTTPGVLGNGGSTAGWSNVFGSPEIMDNEGVSAPYTMALSGNKITSDGISTLVELSGASQYSLSMNMLIDPTELHANTQIKVRISDVPQDGLNCVGNCDEIPITYCCYTDTIPYIIVVDTIPPNIIVIDTIPPNVIVIDTIPIFITFPIDEMLNSGTKYLTLHIENESELPDFKSRIEIDDVCLEPFEYIIVGTEEVSPQNEINLYPNPTSGNLVVEFSEPITDRLDYRIYDLWGRVLQDGILDQGISLHHLKMDRFAEGVYLIEIGNTEKGWYHERIVKTTP